MLRRDVDPDGVIGGDAQLFISAVLSLPGGVTVFLKAKRTPDSEGWLSVECSNGDQGRPLKGDPFQILRDLEQEMLAAESSSSGA